MGGSLTHFSLESTVDYIPGGSHSLIVISQETPGSLQKLTLISMMMMMKTTSPGTIRTPGSSQSLSSSPSISTQSSHCAQPRLTLSLTGSSFRCTFPMMKFLEMKLNPNTNWKL